MLSILNAFHKSKHRLLYSALIIGFVSLFSACQKEFSIDTPITVITDSLPGNIDSLPNHADSLAIYALISDAGHCATAVSSGTSQVGVPYTSNNFQTILVEVSKTGYWSYPAVTLGGITFSGSGYFPNTGSASITLYGTGTPATAGNFDYPLNFNNVACSFRNIVLPADAVIPPDNSTSVYYKANIGGTDYSQEATATNGYIAGSSLSGTDDVSITADISPENDPYPANSTSMVITKGIMHNYFAASDNDFKAFFSPGNYPFTQGTDDNPFINGDGFYIQWVDGQGNAWSTLAGTGDQTNSFIKIISTIDDPDPTTYYVRVKLQFSCKLYRMDTGEMRQLTNGEFVGFFGKI